MTSIIFGDYITLMLVNMAAGLFVLAAFFNWGINSPSQRNWCPGLAITGLVAFIMGLHMTIAWPIPGNYSFANVVFGEMSVLFGAAMIGASLALAFKWLLHSVAIYGFVISLAAIVVGIRLSVLGLTQAPQLSMAGFVLTGLVGVFALPVVGNPQNPILRRFVALVSAAAGLIWLFNGLMGYWAHVAGAASGNFIKW